ncbi:MAG: PKD domain-containing protein [Solirubrobacterales bacterium]|nr:PKD domain-containing protein [Solirubrobacterales bacterium]
MARFALALVTGLVVLCATSAGALADNGSDVLLSATVYSSSGNSTDSVTLGALQADPTRCPMYGGPQTMQELGRQGFVAVQLPPSGAQTGTWSVATALGCMQTPIPLSAVQGITVLGLDGSPQAGAGSLLKPADLGSPSDFNDTAQTPVVEALGSLNQYDRPWRGGSDQDYLDEVQQSQNGQAQPIAIEVFEGPLLAVSVHASRTSVPVGGSVTFRARVIGAGASALSYAWSFGGGASDSTAAAPRIRFASAGQYDVTVQVTDQAGGAGLASIPITVGGKPEAATGTHPRSGAGTSLTSHSPTGPLSSAGQHAGGRPGSTRTGGSTPSTTHPTPITTPSPSTTPASTETTLTTPTTPVPTSPVLTPHPSTPAPRPHAAPRPRTTTRRPITAPKGPVVAGRLISDVIALGPGASPLVHVVPATVASAPPARRAIRASVLPAAGAALAVLLLLGLGAARELRFGLDWRTRRPGN